MSFADELAKLQRVRRAYVRLGRDANPTGPWVGEFARCYGKEADPSGPVPIKGTVAGFGSFTSAIANAEFPLEVPSNQTTLTDPEREWRALGDRPSTQLLQRRLEYFLRQEDDAGAIIDTLVGIGQIANPSFPPGKCQLTLNVPGGDFLGETVGRRVLTAADWPFSLPDDRGKVIPFVYGRLVNRPPETTTVTTTVGGGSGVTSPTVDNCGCTLDGWSGGATLLWEDNFDGYADATALHQNWPSPGDVRSTARAHSGVYSVGQTNGWISRSVVNALPGNVYMFGLQVYWTGEAPGFGILAQFEESTTFNGFDTQCGLRVTAGGELAIHGNGSQYGISAPVMQLNAWNCVTGLVDITATGSFRIYHNGVKILEGTGDMLSAIYRGVTGPRGFTVGLDTQLWIDDVWVAKGPVDTSTAFYCTGTTGSTTTPTTTTSTVTSTTFTCPGVTSAEDANSAVRGGWLRALLVDAGAGAPAISDVAVPTGLTAGFAGQPFTAPTLSATIVAGGSGQIGSVQYYACCTIHSGVMSELSNVVGPITITDPANAAVDITFTGLAPGADSVRLFRGTDPDFIGAFNAYSVAGGRVGISDIPASDGGVTDFYPGLDIQDQLTPETHWDINWRHQVYYTVAARYTDGSESACTDPFMVELSPRNNPLDINVSWTLPAGSLSAIVVRRMSQTHHWEIVPDREWILGPTATTLLDPINDVTEASPCATATIPGTGTPSANRNRYVLAGHTLKSIIDVFVLKPDPAVVDSTGVPNGSPIWVKMTPGVDYYDEVVEVNDNRYHTLVFNQPQRSPTCEFYEVTANVEGATYTADQAGDLITNADDIFEHIMLNVILNTYRSSVGTYAPSGGQWFTDVPYSPGLLDHASVMAAKAVGALWVSGGLTGAGALTEPIGTRELIYQLLKSYGLSLYQYGGVWYVKRFNPSTIIRSAATAITPDTGIVTDSFEPSINQDKHVNVIPYFAGPLRDGGSTQGFLVSGELRDVISIELYRSVIVTEPYYLNWTQDGATALSVVLHYLQELSFPPIEATFSGPVRWWGLPVESIVAVTHPEGLSATGWVNRLCRVMRVALDLDETSTTLTVRDIDNLVP